MFEVFVANVVDALVRLELTGFEKLAPGDGAASRPGGPAAVALRARDGPLAPSWLWHGHTARIESMN